MATCTMESFFSLMTLTFHGHDPVKSHFGPYLNFCCTNCHQILTQHTLGQSLSINQKISLAVWTGDIRERVTLATIVQKDVFAHNFWTKALRMTILASRSMSLRSRHPVVPFVLTYDLDQGHDLPEIIFWAISPLVLGKTLKTFTTR